MGEPQGSDVGEPQGSDVGGPQGSRSKTDYFQKYNLHENVGVINEAKSKFEILLMIFHIILRHGMTGAFVENMLQFFNEICGQQIIPATKYLFNQIFTPSLPVNFHYFCTKCNMYLGERQTFIKSVIECPTCKAKCNVKNVDRSNFFTTMPLVDQIEKILQKPGIKIISNHSASSNYCDIRDGNLFKKLCDPGQPLNDKDAICLNF